MCHDTARLQIKPLNATTIPAVLLGEALSGKVSLGLEGLGLDPARVRV